MKKLIILLGLLGLAGCHSSPATSKNCVLQKIPVISSDPARNEVYTGKGAAIEVQFRNENAPKPADIFPDPRVTVKNITTAESCDIKDGSGIWSGKAVYLEASEHVLVLNEYSGSSDTLIFYDPKTCRRLAELDVSNRRWEIATDRIRTGQACGGNEVNSCRHIQEWMLNKHCVVEESKSITIK